MPTLRFCHTSWTGTKLWVGRFGCIYSCHTQALCPPQTTIYTSKWEKTEGLGAHAEPRRLSLVDTRG